MLLAAGKGERLRPLTDTLPKALVDVNGRSLIERHLDALPDGTRVVINLGWLGGQIAARVGSGDDYGVMVIYSNEGENILETGGGIHRALPMLGSRPFTTINADILTDMPLPPATRLDGALVHLVLVPTPAYRERGDFGLDPNGRVTNTAEYTYAGVAVYAPEFFKDCRPGRYSVVPMWRDAVDAGLVTGSLYTGYWSDVGTPERLASARAEFS